MRLISGCSQTYLDDLSRNVPLFWLCEVQPEVQAVWGTQAGPHVVAAQQGHQAQLLSPTQGLKHLQAHMSDACPSHDIVVTLIMGMSGGMRTAFALAWYLDLTTPTRLQQAHICNHTLTRLCRSSSLLQRATMTLQRSWPWLPSMCRMVPSWLQVRPCTCCGPIQQNAVVTSHKSQSDILGPRLQLLAEGLHSACTSTRCCTVEGTT